MSDDDMVSTEMREGNNNTFASQTRFVADLAESVLNVGGITITNNTIVNNKILHDSTLLLENLGDITYGNRNDSNVVTASIAEMEQLKDMVKPFANKLYNEETSLLTDEEKATLQQVSTLANKVANDLTSRHDFIEATQAVDNARYELGVSRESWAGVFNRTANTNTLIEAQRNLITAFNDLPKGDADVVINSDGDTIASTHTKLNDNLNLMVNNTDDMTADEIYENIGKIQAVYRNSITWSHAKEKQPSLYEALGNTNVKNPNIQVTDDNTPDAVAHIAGGKNSDIAIS